MIIRSAINNTANACGSNHTRCKNNHNRCKNNHNEHVSVQTGLAEYSPKDAPWDRHRANTDDIAGMYEGVPEFEKIQSNIYNCSGWLGFSWQDDMATGESKLKLKKANFCRSRHCPVCQWRRSLMWQARFYQALPKIADDYPKARWLFLTLTVRNCDIGDLKETCKAMSKAWNKFIKRADLKPIKGWIRTTEVTRGDDRSAHPHFHVLVMVPPSWFTHNYVKQSRWIELWQESLQSNYKPNVDIRVVKPKKGSKEVLTQVDMLQGVVSETLKYATKAEDLKADKAWFLEYNRQVKGLRFMATGGALKNILKQDQETNQDMIATGDEEVTEETNAEIIKFNWQAERRQYHKAN